MSYTFHRALIAALATGANGMSGAASALLPWQQPRTRRGWANDLQPRHHEREGIGGRHLLRHWITRPSS